MVPRLQLKAANKKVAAYYASLEEFQKRGVEHETAVRSAFQALLDDCARQFDWKLVPEYAIRRKGQKPVRVDGGLVDSFNLAHGFWEAKDTQDDLEKEIKAKFAIGYPRNNILFQSPRRAILYQNGQRLDEYDISKPERLVDALRAFLEYQEPALEEWDKAIEEFRERISEHGEALKAIIEKERKTNKGFIGAFDGFVNLCRTSLNPNLSEPAVEEMLIQHILTERIFRKIFDVGDFMQRNVIAVEIEKVVQALTSRHFSRDEFLKTLDRFYVAIEHAASTITDFSEKQKFLNTVYERFFQGFAVKVADTMGIVYTPQPIVDFMVKSVEHLLDKEFNKSLAHKQVHILDGFTGTGNFIVNIMQDIPPSALPHKFDDELHCNEVMLLPYYIASMNIEHAYFEATGQYKPFEGICLVDTFETAEEHSVGGVQHGFEFFTKENTERIKRQRKAPIFVCIGNPPYNAGQLNENDNNKNRKYPELDRRVSMTYGASSTATLLRKLADPYVKAIRWASDRIGDEGIVAFINNNSFVDDITFDGMRKHIEDDFDLVHILDLGGNVRKHPELSGTTHNVFGIQVGVSINIFVRLPRKTSSPRRNAAIYYHALPVDWRKELKYDFLGSVVSAKGVKWTKLKPDKRHTWLTVGNEPLFASFTPIGSKEMKARGGDNLNALFKTYSLGVATNRDEWVYDFSKDKLVGKVKRLIRNYNYEVTRATEFQLEQGRIEDVDHFVHNDANFVKWTDRLKQALLAGERLRWDGNQIRSSQYRPFARKFLYFDHLLIQRRYQQHHFFPTRETESENRVIITPGPGNRQAFGCFLCDRIPALDFAFEKAQCFPFYTYDEDGTNRRENIPRSALVRFQTHFDDDGIDKWDVFYYVYGILHHWHYREEFNGNLKRELPRIPMVEGKETFYAFVRAGKALGVLHLNYQTEREFSLEQIENREVPLNWRVEKMKLAPDQRTIIYNEFLILQGIPPEVFKYRLGNRSALEWVIDQYQVSVDSRSGIETDPNRLDDEQYIVRLIGQVITVSLETQKIIGSLPELDLTTAR